MADTPGDPYPRLAPEEIRRLDAVFLTHSHADHAGALPWLYENGFRGTVAASGETLAQLSFEPPVRAALEVCCLGGSGGFGSVRVHWGRSGHCAGSVWYHFSEGRSSILFSGDCTEDTLVYACDPIRGRRADAAVLDCAYGTDETPYDAACGHLVRETGRPMAAPVLFARSPPADRPLRPRSFLSRAGGTKPARSAAGSTADSTRIPAGRPAERLMETASGRPARRKSRPITVNVIERLSAILTCRRRYSSGRR